MQMKMKNAIMIVAVLLASGATSAFAQESHIGSLQGHSSAGKTLYRRYCIGCHGVEGNGAGENAAWVDPKPRDFTAGVFKCRSTPTGTLPTDQDLFNAITRGFVTTSMPSWKPLTDQNRADLVAYVKTFSGKWQSGAPGTPIVIPAESAVTIDSILHGRELFQKMECWKCHGPTGHGDGPSASSLTDSKDNPIRPYNFAVGSRFKCGITNEDLYRIFMTGLDGTPMPSFADVIKPQEAWDLVHFLRTLQPLQTKEAEVWKDWQAKEPAKAKALKAIGPDQGTMQGSL
jgi:mono/diheme cytochrome c family protein